MVQEQQFGTAAELWNALSPTNSDLFGNALGYRHLMFRGQPDSSMKLIPSAFRASNPSRIFWQTKHGDRSPSEDEQVAIELAALRVFAGYADDAGIRIPNDSQTFRNMLFTPQHARHPIPWPDKVFFEILTLAQHHGVCTRLLDWTLNPYIAIYFAASSAMARHDNSELAIWIRDPRVHEMGVRTIKPAGSVSLRTAAQHSLFTLRENIGTVYCYSLGLDEIPEFSKSLSKLTAPVRESIRLLDLCKQIGISAASIYPSTEGAGKATVEYFLRNVAEEDLRAHAGAAH